MARCAGHQHPHAGHSFVQHIAGSTGASVQLRGQGSGDAEGPDPLHVFIQGPTAAVVDHAKR